MNPHNIFFVNLFKMKQNFSAKNHLYFLLIILGSLLTNCNPLDKNGGDVSGTKDEERIQVVKNTTDEKIDILIDGELFTSYMYPAPAKKPILFPLKTASGKSVTRGFPIDPQPWERVDHPHHVGMWFNHGDVNDLDFWNNSDSIPQNRSSHYGTIYHKGVESTKNGDDYGFLEVKAQWERPDGRIILEENTKYFFRGNENTRIIDRLTTLTATEIDVLFKDSKEGMMAIRVNRALELPENRDLILLNEDLIPVEVKVGTDSRSKGNYLNSEGIEGAAVWGKRAKWVRLSSEIEKEPTGIIIMDHPENPNYPTYWHARTYGLFSANPMGSKDFTRGKETFNYFLPREESVSFKYRVLIYNGTHPGDSAINLEFDRFVDTFNN